jgi:15-cis-phytoene synthase
LSSAAFIQSAARDTDPDRYAAALLAPAQVRDDLIVVAAYLGDVARIPLIVAEPTLAEIRLQWWRETIQAGAQGGLSGNPVADAMVRTISRHGLTITDVLAPLDARRFELHDDACHDQSRDGAAEDRSAFEAYLEGSEGAPSRLAAAVLGHGQDIGADATRPYALVRLAMRLPLLLAKGRWPLPASYSGGQDPRLLAESEARDAVRQATTALVAEALSRPLGSLNPAMLPAALVRSYAKALLNPARDPLRQPAEIAPLTRLTRLWWASIQSRT